MLTTLVLHSGVDFALSKVACAFRLRTRLLHHAALVLPGRGADALLSIFFQETTAGNTRQRALVTYFQAIALPSK